jgi:hypothetical protein
MTNPLATEAHKLYDQQGSYRGNSEPPRGLWINPNPILLWDWRKRGR